MSTTMPTAVLIKQPNMQETVLLIYVLSDQFFFLAFQSAQALALGLFPPSSPSSGKSQVVDINVMDKDYDDIEPNPR